MFCVKTRFYPVVLDKNGVMHPNHVLFIFFPRHSPVCGLQNSCFHGGRNRPKAVKYVQKKTTEVKVASVLLPVPLGEVQLGFRLFLAPRLQRWHAPGWHFTICMYRLVGFDIYSTIMRHTIVSPNTDTTPTTYAMRKPPDNPQRNMSTVPCWHLLCD